MPADWTILNHDLSAVGYNPHKKVFFASCMAVREGPRTPLLYLGRADPLRAGPVVRNRLHFGTFRDNCTSFGTTGLFLRSSTGSHYHPTFLALENRAQLFAADTSRRQWPKNCRYPTYILSHRDLHGRLSPSQLSFFVLPRHKLGRRPSAGLRRMGLSETHAAQRCHLRSRLLAPRSQPRCNWRPQGDHIHHGY